MSPLIPLFFNVLFLLANNGVQSSSNDCINSALSRSSNDFGSQLVSKIGGNGNFFASPFSIYAALAMTYLGAGGRTAQQMEDAFQLSTNGLNGGQLHASFQQLLRGYQRGGDQNRLLLANGIFLQQNYQVEQHYAQDVAFLYQGTVELVDFANDGEAAKDEINQWVAEKTENKIAEFLSEPLDSVTRLALLNAIYFKAEWEDPFDPQATRNGMFYRNDGTTKTVEFMSGPDPRFPYLDDGEVSGYQFLELPYKGSSFSMLLAMPNSRLVFPILQMDSYSLCGIYSKLQPRVLDEVNIPKFRMEYEKQLKSVLKELGIEDLFTPYANLTGIRAQRDLAVSSVLHKAVVNVNEQGTEAVAVSGVFMYQMSLKFGSPSFVADHPFLFYIIDKRNMLVLFSGRVMDP